MEFVHHAGFIGGAWSMETAIKMAEISMEASEAENGGNTPMSNN